MMRQITGALLLLLAGFGLQGVRAEPQQAIVDGHRVQPRADDTQRKLEAQCAEEKSQQAREDCLANARGDTWRDVGARDLEARGTSGSTLPADATRTAPGGGPVPATAAPARDRY